MGSKRKKMDYRPAETEVLRLSNMTSVKVKSYGFMTEYVIRKSVGEENRLHWVSGKVVELQPRTSYVNPLATFDLTSDQFYPQLCTPDVNSTRDTVINRRRSAESTSENISKSFRPYYP